MIFLSHTHSDKSIVDQVANHLQSVFGRDKIFYDSWSIQPGDGIIDKINKGLSACEYFFFFVSKNSLQSNMVKIEWQNALYKSTKLAVKIIPVKVDDCMMPEVLLQTLYIDIFGQGLEVAIRQIVDVASNKSTYNQIQGFQNVRAYIQQIDNTYTIEIKAESYMEPHSKYLILVDNKKTEIEHKVLSDSFHFNNFQENILPDSRTKINAIYLGRESATTPGFPFVIQLKGINTLPKLMGIMRAVSYDKYQSIPIITPRGAQF